MGKKVGKTLTDRQATFVREYLIDLNATQACVRAGYCKNSKNADVVGPQLLKNTGVARAIQGGMDRRAAKLQLTAEKVLRDLEEIRLRCLAIADFSNALKASELQGKHLKLFGADAQIINNYASLTDEQIQNRINEIQKKGKK